MIEIRNQLTIHNKQISIVEWGIMKNTWRLILSDFETGAWNMALDEAILMTASQSSSLPTLRLYGWQPATFSLGFSQPASDVDLERLERAGWGLVRRPTGGRAILHVDELTYAVITAQNLPLLSGSLLDSYRIISSALLASMVNLGIAAVSEKIYERDAPAKTLNPVCFEMPSNYEITANNRKLIGSAQARKHGGILQHGSLPITGDISRITNVLIYESEEARRMAALKVITRATTLETEFKAPLDWATVSEAVIKGFQESFDISLVPGQSTQEEMDLAAELVESKYGNPDWTFRM